MDSQYCQKLENRQRKTGHWSLITLVATMIFFAIFISNFVISNRDRFFESYLKLFFKPANVIPFLLFVGSLILTIYLTNDKETEEVCNERRRMNA